MSDSDEKNEGVEKRVGDIEGEVSLKLPRYHRDLIDYFQRHENELWEWFSSHEQRVVSNDAIRADLLKSTYRIDRETSSDLYDLVDNVSSAMKLHCSITVYQAQNPTGFNASIAWQSDAVHVVLHGQIQELLSPDELKAVIAHELAHYGLLFFEANALVTADLVLNSMLVDANVDTPHHRTARTLQIWTELHCDQRAAQITDDTAACISSLLKLETGLREVNVSAYLDQADEVFDSNSTSDGQTHPEMFIRAKALSLWDVAPETVDSFVESTVQGPLCLQTLDLMQQRKLMEVTADFVTAFLQEEWFHTPPVLGHALRFLGFRLSDRDANATHVAKLLKSGLGMGVDFDGLKSMEQDLRNYFCYLLLDFCTIDPELDESPLAAAYLFAETTGILADFQSLVWKELKLSKRAAKAVERDAESIIESMRKELNV